MYQTLKIIVYNQKDWIFLHNIMDITLLLTGYGWLLLAPEDLSENSSQMLIKA